MALEYHDVVPSGSHDASGFPGPAAGSYKLLVEDFDAHLRAVSGAVDARVTIGDLEGRTPDGLPVLLTFDDGGRSAYTHIADRLEACGWRGHFFMPTDYIGRPRFLTAGEIRELRRRGHVIGSHSSSHPLRMARCAWPELLREWSQSTQILSELLGERTTIASVPGGALSQRVAEAAAEAGIRTLFTSEPVTRTSVVANCMLVGRFTLRSRTPASVAARLALGRLAPRALQWAMWNAKALIKWGADPLYLRLREWWLER